jgi:AraC-like DNA-binding protein
MTPQINPAGAEPNSIQLDSQIAVFQVERATYKSLKLVDIVKPHWTISFVLEGNVETTIGGETVNVKPGSVMIHPPYLPFSEAARIPGTHLWFSLHANAAPMLELLRLYPLPTVLAMEESDRYPQLFEELLLAWQDSGCPFREWTVTAKTLLLVSVLLKRWERLGRPMRPPHASDERDRFPLVIRYMMERYPYRVSRQQLADLIHLHPVYLDRLFSQQYGITPMRMLREIRLRQARTLLESGDEPINRIAVMCGFGEAPYLNRLFLKSFGETPGSYRERMKAVKQYDYNGEV